MLTYITGALALSLVAVIGRYFLVVRPADTRQPFPRVGCALLLGATLAAAWIPVRTHLEENQLARASVSVIGVSVRVHCQSLGATFTDAGNESGYVRFDAQGVPMHETLLKYETCAHLRAYLHQPHHPSIDELAAVHVLTHESMHMRGTVSESEAECAAVQRDAQMARALGANPRDAAGLARTYFRIVYPQLRDEYRSGGCSQDGQLDEHLPDPPW